ncbi:MAG: enoyl-CoA hydratase/isomerase family protein [Candidatus Thorarchaeota archaeon]|nr:enoyl-CoA hydratase/isomerase family protein [Candidatus Thorarchaeota archaeon]
MTGEIKVSIEDAHAVITISRPDKLNSVTKPMLVDFNEQVSQIINNPNIRAVIFTGEGSRAFSAGFDMDTIMGLKGAEVTEFFKLLERTMRLIRENRTCITIAAVNGYAIGFGAMAVLACDFRFFSDTAAFRLPEVELGVFPGAGAASNLLHLVGPARAKDILLTTRTVSAKEALQIGLADMLVNQDELMEKTMEFVEGILNKDATILVRTKTLIDGMTGKDIADADELESAYLDEWLREREES